MNSKTKTSQKSTVIAKAPKASKTFKTRNGETFKVDTAFAALVQDFGPTSYMSCGSGRRYVRNDRGEYLARVIAKRVYGNVAGKRVSFKDGDSRNLLSANLILVG